MEKPHRMQQVYGYLVCLTAVITVIICAATLIGAVLDLGDPIHAGFQGFGAPSLASYDNYKMDILKSVPRKGDVTEGSYLPDEKTLRTMYESAREDKILQVKHDANRTIIVDSILIALCVVLFVTHWRWMRKLARVEAAA